MLNLQINNSNYLFSNEIIKPNLDLSKNFPILVITDPNLSNLKTENTFNNKYRLIKQNHINNSCNFRNNFFYFNSNQRKIKNCKSNDFDNSNKIVKKHHHLNQMDISNNDIFYSNYNSSYHKKYCNNQIWNNSNISRNGFSNDVVNNIPKNNYNHYNCENYIYLTDLNNNFNSSNPEFDNKMFNTSRLKNNRKIKNDIIHENDNNILYISNLNNLNDSINNHHYYIDKFGNKRPFFKKITINKCKLHKKLNSHSYKMKYNEFLNQCNNGDINFDNNNKKYRINGNEKNSHENLVSILSSRKDPINKKIVKQIINKETYRQDIGLNNIGKDGINKETLIPKKSNLIIIKNNKINILENKNTENYVKQKKYNKIANEKKQIDQITEKKNVENNKIKNSNKINNIIKEIKEDKKETPKKIDNNKTNDENKNNKNYVLNSDNNIIIEIKKKSQKDKIGSNEQIKAIEDFKENKQMREIKENKKIKPIIPINVVSETKKIISCNENKEKIQMCKTINDKTKNTEDKTKIKDNEEKYKASQTKKETNENIKNKRNKENIKKKMSKEFTKKNEIKNENNYLKNSKFIENKKNKTIIQNKQIENNNKIENQVMQKTNPLLEITHFDFIYDKFDNSINNTSNNYTFTSKKNVSRDKLKNSDQYGKAEIELNIYKEDCDNNLKCDTEFQLIDKEILFLKNSLKPCNDKDFTFIDNFSKLQSTNSAKFTLYRTKMKIPYYCSYNKISNFYSDNMKFDQLYDENYS